MYAYCQNNPVMYYDPSGEIGIVIGGIALYKLISYVVAALLTPPGQELLRDGLQAGADAIGSAVNSISQAAHDLKNNIKQKINSTSVAISTALALSTKKNNGTYAIQFSNGNYYIGKGSPFRMYISAMREGLTGKSVPVSFRFEWASNEEQAFITEYKWMVDYGYYKDNPTFYNKRWSTGRTQYYNKYKRLYSDDY